MGVNPWPRCVSLTGRKGLKSASFSGPDLNRSNLVLFQENWPPAAICQARSGLGGFEKPKQSALWREWRKARPNLTSGTYSSVRRRSASLNLGISPLSTASVIRDGNTTGAKEKRLIGNRVIVWITIMTHPIVQQCGLHRHAAQCFHSSLCLQRRGKY